jgi:hypothetical protein
MPARTGNLIQKVPVRTGAVIETLILLLLSYLPLPLEQVERGVWGERLRTRRKLKKLLGFLTIGSCRGRGAFGRSIDEVGKGRIDPTDDKAFGWLWAGDSPDRAIRLDLEGNEVELFDRAYRLGKAEFEIGGRPISFSGG